MRKKFNVKFFAMLVGVTALLAVGVHYLHGFQVKRNAKTLLDQAHEAQKAEHAYQASELYSAYLIYYPDDAATLAEYGALLEDLSARNPRLRSRASAVLDKALRLNRDADIETHRRAIKVAMSLGLFSDAKDHLSTLIKAAPDKGEFEYLLGQCEEANGEFQEAKKNYRDAIDHVPDLIDAYLSLAVLQRRRLDQSAEANQIVEEAVENNPNSFEAYLAQFSYYMEFKELEKAAGAVEMAKELAPEEEGVLLAAANWEMASAKGTDRHLHKARSLLKRGMELYPNNPRMYLLLARVRELLGERPQAIKTLRQGLHNLPNNPDLAWILAELLIADGENAGEPIDLLRQLGVSRAHLDFLQARIHIQDGKWPDAITLLENIRAELVKQPRLSFQADLLLGAAYRQVPNADQQYLAFRRASEADSESVAAILGMGSALLAQGRINEVRELYQKNLPLGLEDLKQAQEAASKERNGFSNHLQLGHLLLVASRSPKMDPAEKRNLIHDAEEAFRKATELSDGSPTPWIELVSFLVQSGRAKEAKDAVESMKGKMDAPYELLVRAHYDEMVGAKEAQSLYEQAADMNKKDPVTQRALAGYYLRTRQFRKTGEFFARISGETPQDLRMQVAILLTQPRLEQRRQAASVLEKLMRLGATPDEQLLLAQLYENAEESTRTGWPKSKQQFADLLTRNGDKAKYVAAYALALCRHQEWDECQTWINKLEHLSEAAEPFVLTEIKARLSAGQHKPDQCIARIQDYVDAKVAMPEESPTRLELGANLAEGLSRAFPNEKSYVTRAEKWYRELAAREPGKMLVLASFLSRQARSNEALECCQRAWASCAPVEVAITALNALRQKPGTAEQMTQLEHSIHRAIDGNPKLAVSLRACLANLYDFQSRYSEAIELYRKVLIQDGQNPMALNNLAWLLALKERRTDDALGLINQAIEKMGPGPSLLDTRGVIFLTMGKPDRALEDLNQAHADMPTPANCFHLAEAHQLSKNGVAAKNAFEQGRRLGMKAERLHPLERADYARLAKELRVEPVE